MGNATDTAEKRVLIVDDSKFVRTTFNRILRSSFVVLEAVDGDAAWKAIQEDSSIVMVFSDLDMPKLDGYGLLRLIRGAKDERIRKLPVIVISGSQDQAANSRARQAGANDFISKSAEAPDVLARIEQTLRTVKPNPRPEPEAPQAAAVALAAAQQLTPAQSTASQQIATIQAAAQQGTPAKHDVLTGTLTSANLLVEARKHFSHARRHNGELSVMAFRVDSHAEAARDAGKDVSDQVLARIAKMIQGMLRTEDSFGRVAEATFMVISAGAGAPQMMGFARRLHSQLEAAQVRHNSRVLKIRTSFGLASLAAATASIEDLMKLALQRLQTAGSRPADPIVGEPEGSVPAASAVPKASAVLKAAASASSTQTPALNLQPAPAQNDVGRALEMLERADPKQLDDATEAVLRGFLDKVVKVLAAREIAKVSI